MKLYTGDLSPYSAKIRMQIYAMRIADDIEFELPLAQFFSGRLKETSPIGRIPILKTDAGVIPESEVIADYLDELYPEKSLLGTTAIERANVRLISRIADIYLMNNIFLSLGQLNPDNRNQAIIDLLMSQVKRGMAALEAHVSEAGYAVGATLTRADCTVVPALFMCERTVPSLGVKNPIEGHRKVEDYWRRIQSDEFASRVIGEMDRGLKARLDGSEQRMIKEAMAAERAAS